VSGLRLHFTPSARVSTFTSAAAAALAVGLIAIGSAVPAGSTGLVAAYNFEEASGTAVTDSSGNGNNGTNNYVTVPDSASLHLTNGMTLEAWVNMTGGQTWRTVIFKERPGGMTYSLFARSNGNRPVGQVYVNAEQNAQGTAAVPTGTWTHLATTYDGSVVRLYQDAVLTASWTVALATVSSSLHLGNASWGSANARYGGSIDEVGLWSRALTGGEITGLYNGGAGKAYPFT